MSKFRVLEIESWPQAIDICRRVGAWVFRGQGSETWPLATKLERTGSIFNCQSGNYPELEDQVVEEFRRRAHNYDASLSDNIGKLDSLSILQHHGCATRLLDFTYSFYVAAFFAMESAEECAAVWAVNMVELKEAVRKKLVSIGTSLNFAGENLWELPEFLLDNNRQTQLVLPAQPKRMHERLSIQQGLFLFPLDITHSFVENLAGTFDTSPEEFQAANKEKYSGQHQQIIILATTKVVKFEIPRHLHKRAIDDLEMMNITRASLFPGLDGFCQSLNHLCRRHDHDLDSWDTVRA